MVRSSRRAIPQSVASERSSSAPYKRGKDNSIKRSRTTKDKKPKCGAIDEQCNGKGSCGHRCTSSSEDCLIRLAQMQRSCHQCGTKCDKNLMCGHYCQAICHESSNCPPCRLKCELRCVHRSCPLTCKELCVPCEKPCDWRCDAGCPQKRECLMACGSPCIRLPCDQRCRKNLECGHRCPSLCGETCPSSEYCREKGCAPESKRSEIVDMILLTTLADHDPDISPLLVLSCGHCMTVESLDSHSGIQDYYNSNGKGKWTKIVPLRDVPSNGPPPTCCSCRSSLQSVRRYRRIIQHRWLILLKKKHFQTERGSTQNSQVLLQNIERRFFKNEEFMEYPLDDLIELNASANSLVLWLKEFEPNARLVKLTEPIWNELKSSKRLPPGLRDLIGVDTVLPDFTPIKRAQAAELRTAAVSFNLLAALIRQKPKHIAAFCDQALQLLLTPLRQYAVEVEQFEAKLTTERELLRSMFGAIACAMRLGMVIHTVSKGLRREPFFIELEKTAEAVLNALENAEQMNGQEALQVMNLRNTDMQELKRFASILRGPIYYPVTLDEKKMIFRTSSSDVGNHWYECENGHLYTIGGCGRAIQLSTCPECRTPVGGSAHQLVRSNREATSFLNQMQ